MTERDASRTQSVERALVLLNCFSAESPRWQLKDLVRETGLTAQTAHRLLRTLMASNFVNQSASTKAYSLGPAVVRLAGAFLRHNDLAETVRPEMVSLREMSGETVALHWLVDMERLRVDELVSNHPIRMTTGVGQTKPLHRGAAGKALLAFLPDDQIRAYLAAEDAAGHLRRPSSDIEADLAACRRDGYAVSLGEDVAGAASIAAPIRDRNGNPIAALSVTGPEARWTVDNMAMVAPTLVEIATKVGRTVG